MIFVQLAWFGYRIKISGDMLRLHENWKRRPWTLHLVSDLPTDICLLIDSHLCPKCPFN
jgi:hypothetical protein